MSQKESEWEEKFYSMFGESENITNGAWYRFKTGITPKQVSNFICQAISEAVKEERERAEAEKNDCHGCIDC